MELKKKPDVYCKYLDKEIVFEPKKRNISSCISVVLISCISIITLYMFKFYFANHLNFAYVY